MALKEVAQVQKDIEYIKVQDNKVKKVQENFLNNQDYYTDFSESSNVVKQTKKSKELYRHLYLNGIGKWYPKEYQLGFSVVNKHYADRVIRTISQYMLEDIQTKDNVISVSKIKELTRDLLKYKRIMLRPLKRNGIIELVKFYDWQLDKDSNVIIEYKQQLYYNVYNDELQGYVYTPVDEKIINTNKDLSNELNMDFIQEANSDLVLDVSSYDVIGQSIETMHQLDRLEAKFNYEAVSSSTIQAMPESYVKDFKKGNKAIRQVKDPLATDKNAYLTPAYVEYPQVMSEINLAFEKVMSDLTSITNINFMLNLKGSQFQTATEYAGREKPFIQMINELNNIVLPQFQKFVDVICEMSNVGRFELVVSPFELLDTMKYADNLIKIEQIKHPRIKAETMAEALGKKDDAQYIDKLEQDYMQLDMGVFTDMNVGEI